MIARIWSARATASRAPVYADHLRAHVLPALQGLDGYQGAQLLQRDTEAGVELTVVTYWASLDAVRGFAGPDAERAVVADEAAALLTDFDRHVRHYDVLVNDARPGPT